MAQTKMGDLVVNTIGNLPSAGTTAPDFILTNSEMKDSTLKDFAGKNVILNIFPSIETSVCQASAREFNKRVAALPDTVVLCISKDLPGAQKRFCAAEGIANVTMLSDFRGRGFSKSYGIELIDGKFAGLFARSVVVIDKSGKVKYTELVPAIGQEPNYEAAIKAI